MIKDSGNRTEFESGAVRDIQEGKGRCDLLPLDVVSYVVGDNGYADDVLDTINQFTKTGESIFLYDSLEYFRDSCKTLNTTMVLDVSVHFEEGAKKYGERNWEKGIPVSRYIDSGVRHYLKYLRGDDDERHDRAFCWNMMCAIWTCKHHPHLNEYAKNNNEWIDFKKEP